MPASPTGVFPTAAQSGCFPVAGKDGPHRRLSMWHRLESRRTAQRGSVALSDRPQALRADMKRLPIQRAKGNGGVGRQIPEEPTVYRPRERLVPLAARRRSMVSAIARAGGDDLWTRPRIAGLDVDQLQSATVTFIDGHEGMSASDDGGHRIADETLMNSAGFVEPQFRLRETSGVQRIRDRETEMTDDDMKAATAPRPAYASGGLHS